MGTNALGGAQLAQALVQLRPSTVPKTDRCSRRSPTVPDWLLHAIGQLVLQHARIVMDWNVAIWRFLCGLSVRLWLGLVLGILNGKLSFVFLPALFIGRNRDSRRLLSCNVCP